MKLSNTTIKSLIIVELEPHEDRRGGFARAYCKEEFKAEGINCDFVQDNISYNHKKNTIRGMHWQKAPFEEDKLIRCIAGGIYDVVVDMRLESPTYLKWFGIELTADNRQALFIPKGFAHGYQTLTDNAVVYYKVSENYQPTSSIGCKYNETKIGIEWKELEEKLVISEQDKTWERL